MPGSVDTSLYATIRPMQFPDLAATADRAQQIAAINEQRQSLAQERQLQVQALQRKAQQDQLVDGLMKSAFTADPQTGVASFNRSRFEQGLIQGGLGHLYPQYAETLDKLDDSAAKFQVARRTLLANTILGIHEHGDTPELVAHAGAMLLANGAITRDHLQPLLDDIAQNPDPTHVKSVLDNLTGAIPEYGPLADAAAKRKAETLKAQTEKLGAGDKVVNLQTGQVIAQGEAPKVTEADLDARYQQLLQKKTTGGALTPAETAEMGAYQQRKLLGPEATAAAAADRQAATIAQQNAIQQRGQDFQIQQAGRKELSEKVEQPYLDAKEKAATLRSVIEAAKNGNMAAGSVQSLLGTLGLVTMEGVKRINTTELQSVQGAGSLLERLKGAVGGLTAGQKLSPKLQNDLQELSDLLEKSATQKYQEGFAATTKRYGLKDERPLTPAAAPATTAKESAEHRVWRLTGKQGTEPK